VHADLAHDAAATIAQATALWQRLSLPNVMIKVPGTPAGLEVVEALTCEGINVTVTLLFGTGRYEQVVDAYVRRLTARADATSCWSAIEGKLSAVTAARS